MTPVAVWMIDGADGASGPYTVDELCRALRPGDKLRMGSVAETAPELAELRATAEDIARLEAELRVAGSDPDALTDTLAELRRRLRMAQAERRRLILEAAALRTRRGHDFKFTARTIAAAAGISHTAVNKLVADL